MFCSGELLASCSGDGTAKLWNFREGRCVITYTDHQQPVWDCSWHSIGSFLATSSMDHTVKIWDIVSERCYLTLRGHADSVNSVNFLAYSNLLCTSSADKTVSLWDARNVSGPVDQWSTHKRPNTPIFVFLSVIIEWAVMICLSLIDSVIKMSSLSPPPHEGSMCTDLLWAQPLL